jgi:hypothetical protein
MNTRMKFERTPKARQVDELSLLNVGDGKESGYGEGSTQEVS